MTAELIDGGQYAVAGWANATPEERLWQFFDERLSSAPIVYQEGRIRRGVGADVRFVLRAKQTTAGESA